MKSVTPVLLLILDGFGHRLDGDDNAIALARTPNWDRLRRDHPYGTIDASERAVGLPRGQFGNSEVGHLNIGAGRIVTQDISRIDLDIEAVRKVVDLNLFGIILPTMTFTRAMIEQKQGSIINISSESAIRPLTRVAGYGEVLQRLRAEHDVAPHYALRAQRRH